MTRTKEQKKKRFREISISSLADFSFSPQSSIICSFSDDYRRSFTASSSKAAAAVSTVALSLFLIGLIIVFVRILCEIKSRFMHRCLPVIHGLKIHGQHNWKQLF
jgi:hypothetical protein